MGVAAAAQATLAICVMAAGCGEPASGPDGIDRETFVAAYTDLRRAVVVDSLDDTARDSVLAAHGVTAEDLRDYVDRRATDPQSLSETWREILDSIAARDSTAARDLKVDSL